MKRLATRDVAAGLLFATFGVVGTILSLEEQIGTTARMGSGYVPLLLSCGLVVLGAAIGYRGVRDQDRFGGIANIRPVAMILLSIIVFGLSVRALGLAPAVFLSTLVACYAEPGRKLVGALVFATVASIFCVLVFIRGLGLIIPAFVTPWTF